MISSKDEPTAYIYSKNPIQREEDCVGVWGAGGEWSLSHKTGWSAYRRSERIVVSDFQLFLFLSFSFGISQFAPMHTIDGCCVGAWVWMVMGCSGATIALLFDQRRLTALAPPTKAT